MKLKLLLLTFVFPIVLFSQRLEFGLSVGASGEDRGNGICTDKSGNAYVTGYYSGTSDFDPSNLTYNLTAVGDYDAFVAKYDSTGKLIWAKSIGGKFKEEGYSVQTDDMGNVFVAGKFQDTGDFNPGSGQFLLKSNSLYTWIWDAFVLKLDQNGNFVWAQSYGADNNDFSYSLCLDKNNNVLVTGTFMGKVDFKNGPDTFYLKSTIPSSSDLFFLKLRNNGDFVYAKRIGRLGSEIPSKILCDRFNSIYISGFMSGDADFDPDTSVEHKLEAAGSFDAFVLKLDSNGNYIWAKNVGGSSEDRCNGMGIDDSLNVYLGGHFEGTADFNPNPLVTFNITSFVGSYGDMFVLKLDKNGNFKWAKRIGGTSLYIINSLAVDRSGNVFGTGYFFGTADFDPNAGTKNLTSNGSGDFFIFKLDTKGDYKFAYSLGNTQNEVGWGIDVDDQDQVYTTGYLTLSSDFDISSNQKTLSSNGYLDVFVAKYAFPPSESIAIVGKDSVCKNSLNYYTLAGISANHKTKWQVISKNDSIIYGENKDTLVVYLNDSISQIIVSISNKNYQGMSDTLWVKRHQNSRYEKLILPNDSVCENSMVYLNTKGLLSSLWQDSILNLKKFKVNNSQKIYLSGLDSNKCAVLDSLNLTVIEIADIYTHPSDQSAGIDSTAEFTCSSNSQLIQWQVLKNARYVNLNNNDTFSGVNTDTLKIKIYNTSYDKNLLRCKVGTDSCPNYSSPAALTVEVKNSVNDLHFKTKVYPNPTTGIIYIDESLQASTYNIIDQLGKTVKEGLCNGNAIDLSKLPEGVYTIQIKNKNSVYRGCLVKVR